MKFSSRKFRILCLLHCYAPREELGTAKLFVGVTRNDKGGATCNNNMKLL